VGVSSSEDRGFEKAEVTAERGYGRVTCADDEARDVPGLFFIGEAVDVTGGWAGLTSSGRGLQGGCGKSLVTGAVFDRLTFCQG